MFRKHITKKTCFSETYLCKQGNFSDLFPPNLLPAFNTKQSMVGSR